MSAGVSSYPCCSVVPGCYFIEGFALPAWFVTTHRDGREKTNVLTNDFTEAAERTQHITETSSPFSLQHFQAAPHWLFLPDF